MTLRLSQWPTRGPHVATELLRPDRIIAALPNTNEWTWRISDGHQPLELSGGEDSGYVQLVGWYEAGSLPATADLLGALTTGYGQQLIWGTLRAYERGGSQPVLTISGFDSTWYDIDGRSDLVAVLEAEFGWAKAQA